MAKLSQRNTPSVTRVITQIQQAKKYFSALYNLHIQADDVTLTDFLSQHQQVGHPGVFEELNAIHAVKAIIFDHVERAVHR